jgi:hypothetical protein
LRESYRKVSYIGLIFLLGIPLLSIASISYECYYDKSSIIIEKVEGEDLIWIKGCGVIEEEGEPILPVDFINLIIPENQIAKSVKVKVSSSYTLPGRHDIKPALNPLNPSEKPKDLSIYNSEVPYPGIRAKIIRTGSFGGNTIAQIAVYPVDYIPKEGKIVLYTDLTIELLCGISNRRAIRQYERSKYVDYINNKALKSIIDNDYDISSYSYRTNIKAQLPPIENGQPPPPPDYVIITKNALKSGFTQLKDYVNAKGLVAKIYTVEYILQSYSSDPVSSISDSAGAIRGFLIDKYDEGAQWVLLGGDESVVPVRYGTSIDNGSYVNRQQPSDLYYSDLDGNWNVDGDEYYGEPRDDSVDIYPELYVGRLPCNTISEINNWFEKLTEYESPTDSLYLKKVFWIASDNLRDNPRRIIEKGSFPFYFTHDTTMLESSDGLTPTGSQVINKMSEHYGWFNFYGHGAPDQLTVSCPDYNHPNPNRDFLVSLDSCEAYWEDSHPNACRVEYGNGLDSLDNTDYYGIMYVASCYQSAYDHENFDIFQDYCGPSIAETFTMLSERGGPAFLGFTRYATYSYPRVLHLRFLDALFEDSLTNIGVAEAISKTQVNSHYIHLSHTLFGCPLMNVWTDVLFDLEAVFDDSIPPVALNFNIRVLSNEKPIRNAYICVWKGHEVYSTGFTDVNGDIVLLVEPETEGEMLLTVTKENFIPYRDKIYITKSATLTNEEEILYAICQTEETLYRNKVLFNFYIPKEGRIKLDIFDNTGRKIIRLIDGTYKKGNHEIAWNGINSNGNNVPEGAYFFHFQWKNQTIKEKFLFLR